MAQQDFRARLQPKNKDQAEEILGPRPAYVPDGFEGAIPQENLLYPLYKTNGVLFPYRPSVSTGSVADYDQSTFIQTNYSYNAYVRSYPKPISISAEFTAQTNDEALYLLAVLHFFRAVTKSYFGINPYPKAGTPPPVLLFNYMGQYQFNNVPVVVKSFDYTYEANVDYVTVYTGNSSGYTNGVSLPGSGITPGFTQVPTHLTVNVNLDTQYSPIKMRDNFNLDEFRSGKLITGGYV